MGNQTDTNAAISGHTPVSNLGVETNGGGGGNTLSNPPSEVISRPVPLPGIAMLTGADGKFTLSVPVAGSYEIGVNADNCAPLSTTVTATPGQDIALQIALQPARD